MKDHERFKMIQTEVQTVGGLPLGVLGVTPEHECQEGIQGTDLSD
jgi:hypothetical protein